MPETRESEPPCSDEQLLLLFHRAARRMAREHHLHHEAVRHAQGHILSILGESGQVSQRELLERLHIRSASLSELLIKMEKNGDITRQRSEKDRRNFILQLTGQGRMKLTEHHQHHRQNAKHLFSILSDAERASLAALLIRLLDAWEAEERRRGDQEEGWEALKTWLKRKIHQETKR